jgi:hypothetical protein
LRSNIRSSNVFVSFFFFEYKKKKKNCITLIIMPRSQRNDNFIDKTFTIVADLLLRIIPTTQREKEAFSYYRDGAICSLIFF